MQDNRWKTFGYKSGPVRGLAYLLWLRRDMIASAMVVLCSLGLAAALASAMAA